MKQIFSDVVMAVTEIDEVKSRKDFRAFLLFPWKVDKGDPNWVPPLLADDKEKFDVKNGKSRGCQRGEISWELEDNDAINRFVLSIGSKIHKNSGFMRSRSSEHDLDPLIWGENGR